MSPGTRPYQGVTSLLCVNAPSHQAPRAPRLVPCREARLPGSRARAAASAAPRPQPAPTDCPLRCFLLNEIEKEEKEKLWYYSQLQGLSKRLDELPHVETVSGRGAGRAGAGAGLGPGRALTAAARPSQQFSMQMDLIRQQLEFEAQHIRSLMEERFGTSDEMVQRAQVRRGRSGPRGAGPGSGAGP